MCDCFHLFLPNWQGSPASDSNRPLKAEEPDDDQEEDDTTIDIEIENVRPRPQGSSPVYEYAVNEYYTDPEGSSLYADSEYSNRIRKTSFIRTSHPFTKMMDSDETMEVTLSTEVDVCDKGFAIAGGGEKGITVLQVLKESPHSNIFCIKEGDQILSATIYFDNITYEDALKILEHSEPYKVQFQLKRKLGKEDREKMQSIVQIKKDKQLQDEDDTITASVKTENDQTVKKREHKKKRSKKDRLSWPKFQSITNTRFLGHRRSRSTSETNEDETTDVYSKVTDATFEDDEIFIAQEKERQYQQEIHGMDIHSRRPIIEKQITDVTNIKNRRAKEKRSLDSSRSVHIDHHGITKAQMKKGLSLQSTILPSSREEGKTAEKERKDIFSEVEMIIVKGKNLPSPCKVSPVQMREKKTAVQNLMATSTTEISTTQLTTKELKIEQFPEHLENTSQGQHSISDDTSSPTKEKTSGFKQRKKKTKKTRLENLPLGKQAVSIEDSCTTMLVGTEHYMDANTTEVRVAESEKGRKPMTKCIAMWPG
ncbi:protein AHNAK2-like [Pseudophryne corroboree]|uniref:protein AHNAK2-like n=1 Tax=Pseudophryne corroboree TaxID=495146 RepID=UPI0030820A31